MTLLGGRDSEVGDSVAGFLWVGFQYHGISLCAYGSQRFALRAPPAKRNPLLVIKIIALVAELVPKVIGAGKSVADLWRSAGGIIADAEKTGNVDADAALRLKALVDAQLAALDRNADEARAG